MEKQKRRRTVCIAVSAVILVIVIALSAAVGIFSEQLDKFVVGYKEGENASAARASGQELAEQIQGEGTVLVKNDGDTLPLDRSDKKLNVFGWSSTAWIAGGSGSGTVKDTRNSVSLLDALTAYGVEYNTELTDMYTRFRSSREYSAALSSFNYEFSRLYEPDIESTANYTASLLANAKAYSDTALVVIGRVSGESNDSPKVQYKRNDTNSSSSSSVIVDEERTYLEISTEEEHLLRYVGDNFRNVIVLINSTNVMELGFLDEIPGLDACLVVATTGTYGANVIPEMLYGDVTPSGKLADTYAYDLTTSSTYANTGSGNDTTNFYTNGDGYYPTYVTHTNGSSNEAYRGVAYTDYQEGIYLGYRWYETADAEGFWDSADAEAFWGIENGYDDVVQYPFGYGLSYTEFSWTVSYLETPDRSTIDKNSSIKVGVTVENVGDRPGQDVVELYYTAPYTPGGVEKPSVALGAYGKTTSVLDPGESEYVELEMDVRDMASYDCYDLTGDVTGGGYVLEAGTYTLSLRSDAHTLADVESGGVHSSPEMTYTVADDIVFRTDDSTGNEVGNLFTGDDTVDGVAIDGNSDGSAEILYLTRADFSGTFPYEMSSARAMTDEIAYLNIYTSEMADEWDAGHADYYAPYDTLDDPVMGGYVTRDVDGKSTRVYELTELGKDLGTDYYDYRWDGLLNAMTTGEMQSLVLHGYTKTSAIDSIGKPQTTDYDGPNQIGSYVSGLSNATGFSTIVLAQTWNTELAYSMGLAVGDDCATYGVSGWYGPGINLHRSPFGGRNFEYFSEDPLISGTMCAREVEAAKNRGVYCYLKHLCLYESESGRDGMYNFLTEQALREIYVKPFEIAVKTGGATGIMTSYGRIGAVWTGGSEALLTGLVRGEWGFQGAFLTDYADHQAFMNGDQMLRAGGNLWMDGWLSNGKFSCSTTSAGFEYAIRNAVKGVVYMWANALATQDDYNAKVASGEIDDTITVTSEPQLRFRWYIPVIVVVDVAAVAGCGIWLFRVFRKKDGSAPEGGTAEGGASA